MYHKALREEVVRISRRMSEAEGNMRAGVAAKLQDCGQSKPSSSRTW